MKNIDLSNLDYQSIEKLKSSSEIVKLIYCPDGILLLLLSCLDIINVNILSHFFLKKKTKTTTTKRKQTK